jgi:2-dehydropantoate 2-reductase
MSDSVQPSIVVMAAGGIGGFVAARLLAAGAARVAVVARGPQLAAIEAEGIALRSELGDCRGRPAVAHADPAEVAHRFGPADFVLFVVKGYDTQTAAAAMAPLVSPHTVVVSLQNGVEGLDILAARYGLDRIWPGVCYVPAVIERPGVIRHTGRHNRFVFGPWAGGADPRAAALATAMAAGGLEPVTSAQALVEAWHKFVMQTSFSALCCLTRLPVGGWIGCADTQALYRRGMEEIVAIARARGVAVAPDIVERNMDFAVRQADRATRASMLEDLERGRPIELASLAGHAHRLGLELGVPTPVNSFFWQALQPHLKPR